MAPEPLLVRALLTSLHVGRDPERTVGAFLRRPLRASTVSVSFDVPEPALLPALVASLEVPSLVKGVAAVRAIGVAPRSELSDLDALERPRLPPRDVGRATLMLEAHAPEAVRLEMVRLVFRAAVDAAVAGIDEDVLGEINHGSSSPVEATPRHRATHS